MTFATPLKTATLPATWHSMSFGTAVRAVMHRNPDKIAIIEGERRTSYGQLIDRADRLRNAVITQFGLGRGDVAAIVARNCTEYLEVVCGVPESGAAVATINPRLAPAEIKAVLDDTRTRLIIADAASMANLRAANLRPDIAIIEIGAEYEALLANAVAPAVLPVVEEWDIWTIPYTSGTTGKPKGVLLSHRSRLLVGLMAATEFGCFGPDDVFLAMSPMNHGGGLGFPAASLSTGGTVDILDRFEPLSTLAKLKYGGITGIFMVPTHFQMIFEQPAAILEEFRLPPITTIISNAAPLPQAMKARIIPYFGDGMLHEIYSSTEAGLVCNLRPDMHFIKASCVGVPFAHTHIEVRRDNGSVCAAEEVGEIWTLSPMLFSGYWNRPEENAKSILGGWVSVGDLAKRDADGFIYIVDRKKDMVISGGVNIYPREIEEVLLHHPLIADVAVVGLPDERWGERLKVFVVTNDGALLTADDVAAFCIGKLATYKIPRELALIDALPRNANGKVLKTDLRARG